MPLKAINLSINQTLNQSTNQNIRTIQEEQYGKIRDSYVSIRSKREYI